jgi:Lrp/AsnC family leucine-responsive transcriptional regulator
MSAKVPLDHIDRKILSILQKDGRITNADLARQVGLSPPSILQRVRKLEDAKIVDGYVAVLNRQNVGLGLMVMVFVSLSLHKDEPIHTFIEQVVEFPEVMECLHVSGEYDFVLKVVIPDMTAYEAFVVEKLTKIASVGKVQSSFVMGTRKHTTEVPVP